MTSDLYTIIIVSTRTLITQQSATHDPKKHNVEPKRPGAPHTTYTPHSWAISPIVSVSMRHNLHQGCIKTNQGPNTYTMEHIYPNYLRNT